MIQRGAGAAGDIVNLIHRFFIFSEAGEEIGLDGVLHVTKIPASFSVPVNQHVFTPNTHNAGLDVLMNENGFRSFHVFVVIFGFSGTQQAMF